NFLHFYTGTHEALGIARGCLRAEFGGASGRNLELSAGDAVILPAGTGHRRLSADKDLLVVGAYPTGGRYDEPKPGEVDLNQARASIVRVPPVDDDPVYGKAGALVGPWQDGDGRDFD
ncbi:MAG TPA: hypothetical protein VLV55_15075, partial [Rhizomicrobium sp.]|nr:hypothetical protein [Rhizomicrobium sp.]